MQSCSDCAKDKKVWNSNINLCLHTGSCTLLTEITHRLVNEIVSDNLFDMLGNSVSHYLREKFVASIKIRWYSMLSLEVAGTKACMLEKHMGWNPGGDYPVDSKLHFKSNLTMDQILLDFIKKRELPTSSKERE